MTAATSSSWFAAPPPTLAVEIAQSRVTVAAVGRSGGERRVLAHATERLPEGAVRPGLTDENLPGRAAVVDALTRALDRAGLGGARRAALVIPDGAARVGLLSFEKVPAQAADLDQLVRWQLRRSSPFPIDNAQLTYFPSQPVGGATLVVAVAARAEVVAEYEAVCEAAGLHVGVVDLASFSVINGVIGAGRSAPADWLVVHLAPEGTTLAIMRGDALMFYRHRPAGEGESLDALIHQTAMYHEDRLGGTAFERVFVSGVASAGEAVEEVRRHISDRLNAAVELVDVRGGASVDISGEGADAVDRLAAPVGLLLRERAAA